MDIVEEIKEALLKDLNKIILSYCYDESCYDCTILSKCYTRNLCVKQASIASNEFNNYLLNGVKSKRSRKGIWLLKESVSHPLKEYNDNWHEFALLRIHSCFLCNLDYCRMKNLCDKKYYEDSNKLCEVEIKVIKKIPECYY